MMKKTIARLLVLAMLLTMVPFAAAATPTGSGGGSSKPTVTPTVIPEYHLISDVKVADISPTKIDHGIPANSANTPYGISVDVASNKVSAETKLFILLTGTRVSEGYINTLTQATSPITSENTTRMTLGASNSQSTLSTTVDLSGVKAGESKYFGLALKVDDQYVVYYRLTVNVVQAESSTYAINAYAMPSAGGTVTASVTGAKAGDKVTVTFKANAGYEFSSLNFYALGDKWPTSDPIDGTYEFTMPAGDVEFEVKFKLAAAIVDTDVDYEGKAEVTTTDPSLQPVVTQIQNSTIGIVDLQLEDEALTMANTAASNQKLVEEAKTKLQAENADDIQFTAKPVMTMTPKEYIEGAKPVLKLDIKGYINVFAELKSSDSNTSVEVGERKPITKPVEICIPLPFSVSANPDYDNTPVAFAAHDGKWLYCGEVTESNVFAFLNPHGFSAFEIGIEDKTVVFNKRVNDESFYTYLTFAAAAEEAEKDDVLILEEDNAEHITLPAGVKVKLSDPDVKFTGTINGKSVTLSTEGYTVPSSSSSSGGPSGNSSKPSIKPGEKPTTPGTTAPSGGVAGFNDVAPGAWYADSVKFVVDKGLFGGVGNGRFAPNDNMTRAMMWTVLARYKGVNTNTGSNWYEAARAWAIEQNISDGTMADGNVTREQFVTMLWRLSGEPAADNAASFTDSGKVSDYAKAAVDWAVAQGIVNGYSDGTFKPQGSATRAEVAKMLTVFVQNEETA